MSSKPVSSPPSTPKRSNNGPYSTSSPPFAPKKRRERRKPNFVRLSAIRKLILEEKEKEWEFLLNSGKIRAKFLNYTPETVDTLEDVHFLHTLKEWYFPASQPRNWQEDAYCQLMREACSSRICELHFSIHTL